MKAVLMQHILQRQRLLQQTPWQLLKQLLPRPQQLAPLATTRRHHHLLLMLQLAACQRLVLLLATTLSGWLLLTCLGSCLGHTLARAEARTSLHTCSGPAAWPWC
jgi:hypothetical protein